MLNQLKKISTYLLLTSMLFALIPSTLIRAETASSVSSFERVTGSVYDNVLNQVYGLSSNQNSADVKGKYLVGYKTKKTVDKTSIAKNANISSKEVKKIGKSNTFAVEINEDQRKALLNDPEVAFIEPNATVIRASLGDIEPLNEQNTQIQQRGAASFDTELTPWGLQAIGADLAAKSGYTGKTVKVAVLDTGIAPHPDLNIAGGVSFVDGTSGYDDDNGHGTHVAGTVAAQLNQIGVVGVAPDTELYAVKVLDQRGFGDYGKVIQGITWAIDNNMDIISMSFGGNEFSQALLDAIQLADASGILLVAAAGNRGSWGGQEETELYPALYPEVISVGSVDKTFQRLYYSSIGSELDIMAPGDEVLSTTKDGSYGYLSGTSMAAPHITGAAAVLWAKSPEMNNHQVKEALLQTATPLGSSSLYGKGIVNLAKALGLIEDAIPPMEVPGSVPDENNPETFDIIQQDKILLSLSEQLLHLKERADAAEKIDLAKRINMDYYSLLAHSRKLHILPNEESGSIKGADINYFNELFSNDYAAFQKLAQLYQEKMNAYISELTSSITGLSGISVLSYNLIGNDQVIKQGQSAGVACTLDNVKDVTVQIVNSNGVIVKSDFIPANSLQVSYVWQTAANTPVGKYRIKFIYPDAPGWDDIFEINVKTGDQTIQQGQSATVTRILDEVKDVDITIFNASGQVIASEYVTNSLITASYTWNSAVDTPVGTYRIHFHYPTDSEWDDDFIVNVVGTGSGQLLPASPYNLSATSADGRNVVFNWTAGANTNSFEVYLNHTLMAANVTESSFSFSNLTPDTNYELGVKGKNSYGTGPMASITFRTTILPPTAPQNVTVFEKTDSSITVHWDYQAGVNNYKLQLNGIEVANSTASSYTFQGLTANNLYSIGVAASNSAGTSSFSSIAARTLPQMLTVGAPIDADIPDGQFGLYSFVPPASGSYRIFTGYYGGFGAESDTILELYSDLGLTQLVLEPSDDANGSVFSELNATLEAGIVYYIKLYGFGNSPVHARLAASLIAGIPEIELGTPVDIETQDNERRVYEYHPSETGSYTIHTGYYQGNQGYGESDTILSVYKNVNLTQMIDDGYNDDVDSGSRFSSVTVTLAANQHYYIAVEGYGNSAVQTRLEVIKNSQIAITPITNKTALDISEQPGKKGYVSFTPAQSGKYRFFTSPYMNDGQVTDTLLELYSDSGLTQLIGTNDDVQGAHPYGELFSKLEATLTAGQPYYAVISNIQSSVALQTRLMVEDSFQSSRETAINSNWNEIYEKDISSLYDVDYYRLQITEPIDINFNITTHAVFLEDNTGNLLQIFTPASRQIYTILSPGTYYARIHYYDGNLASAFGILSGSNIQQYELEGYQSSSKKSNSNNQVIDASLGFNKTALEFEYSQFHEDSIAEVYDNENNLVFSEHIGYKLAGSHVYEWNGRTFDSIYLGLQYDEDLDGTPERYYARNGRYTVLVYPDDANEKHKASFSVKVDNSGNNMSNFFEGIPVYNYDGTLITASNKEWSEKAFNYFMQYVWKTDPNYNSPVSWTAYTAWSRDIYGLNGLEKFWASLGDYVYDPNLSPFDNIQNMITYVGLVPVIGEFADGVNGVIYLIRGDQVNGWLSVAAMVPVIGSAAGGTQIASKVGLKFFSRIDNFLACVNCFTAGTTVLTELGDKPIEAIKVGDMVLAKNPDTGEVAYKRVNQLYQKEIEVSWVISIGNEKLTTTDLHPFWVHGKGWILTKDLAAGDLLESDDGSLIPIESIDRKEERQQVYNISVSDFHTYFVSNLGIFTHNTSCILPGRYLEQALTRTKAIDGPDPSGILGNELRSAGLIPDTSEDLRWEAHHIIAYSHDNEHADAARKLLKRFQIDINSVANGIWLPRKKGTPIHEMINWEDVEVSVKEVIVGHQKIHTKKYFEYVYDKLNDVYINYGPDQDRAIHAINEIREGLMKEEIILGLINR